MSEPELPRRSRRSRSVESNGSAPGRSRRRGRGGRTVVEGWMVALGAVVVVLVLAGALVARVLPRPSKGGAGAASAAAAAPRGAEAAGTSPEPTAVFGHMKKYGVELHFPAVPKDMIAIGFHQAWNAKATDMTPATPSYPREKYETTKKALKDDPKLKTFLMMSRGRGSSEYSAADCAVRAGAIVLSPVTGTVTLVTKYKLEGNIDDYRVEIEADGAAPVRVVMIHIQDVVVKVGDRVEGGVSPVATVRHLTIDSQVNRYLPVSPADHTHIQINDVGYKLNEAS